MTSFETVIIYMEIEFAFYSHIWLKRTLTADKTHTHSLDIKDTFNEEKEAAEV